MSLTELEEGSIPERRARRTELIPPKLAGVANSRTAPRRGYSADRRPRHVDVNRSATDVKARALSPVMAVTHAPGAGPWINQPSSHPCQGSRGRGLKCQNSHPQGRSPRRPRAADPLRCPAAARPEPMQSQARGFVSRTPEQWTHESYRLPRLLVVTQPSCQERLSSRVSAKTQIAFPDHLVYEFSIWAIASPEVLFQ
jgi:hypothetical protein